MGRRIGFTGTQEGMSERQKIRLHEILQPGDEFHHGDCCGSDDEADDIATAAGCTHIVIHPPINPIKRAFCTDKARPPGVRVTVLPPGEYLARNVDIVLATEQMVAAPRTDKEEVRSGTWSTVRAAKRMQRPCEVMPR